MYSGLLTILLCNDSSALRSAVYSCPPLPTFSHTIYEAYSPENTQLAQADVLMFSYVPTNLPHIKNCCKKNAFIVLCLPPDVLATLEAETVDCATELWCSTGSAQYLAGCCRKLFALLREKKEAWLTRNYLETTINSVPDLIWYKDCAGKHCKVNDSFCLAVGKNRQEIEGRGHYYIWDIEPEEYIKGKYICIDSEKEVLKEGKTCLFYECVKSKAGMRQFQTYKTPLRDEDGTIIGTVGVAHDVTNLANMGVELDLLLRNLPFGILVVAENDRIVRSNDYFQQYFEIRDSDIVGKNYKDWCKNFFFTIRAGKNSNLFDVEVRIRGSMHVFEMLTAVIFDVFENPTGTFVIFSDVTCVRENEKRIKIFADTDLLTKAYNRRFFYNYMKTGGKKQLTALIFIDLDNFKGANDTFGHLEGDKVLQHTAELVRQFFPNDMLIRFGGDEFLLCIMHNTELQDLSPQIAHLLQGIATIHNSDISASVGITDARDHSLSLDELVRRADTAMYHAKNSGKNCFCFYTDQLEKTDLRAKQQ